MSTSFSCEERLKELASELHQKAYELEDAARVLATLRNSGELEEKIKKAKEWAKDWLNR